MYFHFLIIYLSFVCFLLFFLIIFLLSHRAYKLLLHPLPPYIIFRYLFSFFLLAWPHLCIFIALLPPPFPSPLQPHLTRYFFVFYLLMYFILLLHCFHLCYLLVPLNPSLFHLLFPPSVPSFFLSSDRKQRMILSCIIYESDVEGEKRTC